MKTLHLVRHAEAAPRTAGVPDHDRALTPRGRSDARRLGEQVRSAGITVDLVLCSTARRAQETLDQFGLSGPEIRFEDRLYEATGDDLLERLRGVPDSVRAVLLVGHNPAVHQLALTLTGTGAALGQLATTFPAGSLASLVAPVDRWWDLAPAGAELSGFVLPGGRE